MMKRTSALPLLLVAAGLSSCVMPVPSRPPEREGVVPPPPRRILPPAIGANRPARGLWEIDRVAQRVGRGGAAPASTLRLVAVAGWFTILSTSSGQYDLSDGLQATVLGHGHFLRWC